jgi:ribosomal protein S18 acetylase RimI-like enzyme
MEIKKITRFNKRTFEAVSRLLPQLSSEPELLTEQYFKSILASRAVHFFIAVLDNKQIAGMLTIGTYTTPTGIKVWIEDVVVDESQRGKGIGKELMFFAIEYSKSLGAKDIRLTSRPSRIAANELYRNLGFEKYETNIYRYCITMEHKSQK